MIETPRLTIPRGRRDVESKAKESRAQEDAALRWRLVMEGYRAGKFDL
jgi:hypothetical protein